MTCCNLLLLTAVCLRYTKYIYKCTYDVLQVKTTQPRRYLVRPNQGLIAPGKEEKVTILLVEKDKNSLLQQYESLGPAALETCKDKFLVQSVAVSAEQAESLTEYDQLTALWTNIQSVAPPTDPTNPNATATTHPKAATANKKLHVQHKVIGSASQTNNDNNVTSTGAPAAPAPARPIAHPERLSKEQLIVELTHLRKKYDELVGFSVNLTAERDVLNNTLEQTKRDLNRELNQSSSIVSGGGGNSRGRSANVAATGSGSGSNFVTLLIYIVTALLMGAKLQQMGFLHGLPGLTFHHRNHHDDEL